MSEEFCTNLAHMKETENNYEYKTLVLADVVKYKMYHTLITQIPGIIWSLLLGAWIDKYKHGRKAIFLVGSLTLTLEAVMNSLNSYYFDLNVNYILVSFLPYILPGNMVWGTAYSYIGFTTPTKYKTLRYTIFEALLAIAFPLGTAVSGKLLMMSPIGRNGQLHNYALLFTISSIGTFIAFLWALFAINQDNDTKNFKENFGEKNLGKEMECETDVKCNKVNPIRMLFDLRNVKDIFTTCMKKRDNYARAQLWLIYLAMFCFHFVILSPQSFLFQFVEKIYNWDAETYSYINSIGIISHTVVLMTITPIFIKVFKMNDMLISIIGFIGLFFEMTIRGIILTPMGFYIAIIASCTANLSSIGFRTHITKIVEPSELGKVLTLMTIIDAIAPIIASSLFTILFKVTIDKIPGTCLLVLGAMSLVPIIIAMAIDIMRISRARVNKCCEKSLSDAIVTKL